MTKDTRFAIFGDPEHCKHLLMALNAEGFNMLDTKGLEIQDEFQVKKWMLEKGPTHVFVCVGLRGMNSTKDFMFTLVGSINVLRGAVGIAQRVRLVTAMPTTEYYVLRRLCELYFFEKELDYVDILYNGREKREDYFRRCVLSMRDVSAKEAHASRTKGHRQGGQVPDQVVSQRQSGEVHQLPECEREGDPLRKPPESLLEVPGQNAQGAPPGDLCSQRDPGPGQTAQDTVHHHASSVQGVVP